MAEEWKELTKEERKTIARGMREIRALTRLVGEPAENDWNTAKRLIPAIEGDENTVQICALIINRSSSIMSIYLNSPSSEILANLSAVVLKAEMDVVVGGILNYILRVSKADEN